MSTTIKTRPGMGMTLEEAQALIDSGYSWVRVGSKSDSQHWGHGKLLRIKGDHGLVKIGMRHRRIEKVPLAYLKPWKSKNTELMQRDGIKSSEEVTVDCFVVDKEQSLVWAGPTKGFLADIDNAKPYENEINAKKGIGAMKRSPRWREIAENHELAIAAREEVAEMLKRWENETPPETKKPEAPTKKPKEKAEPKPESRVIMNATVGKPSEIQEAVDEWAAGMRDIEDAMDLLSEARSRVEAARARIDQMTALKVKEAFQRS